MSDTPSFVDLLRMEVARLQAVDPTKADAIGRAHALIIDGHVVDQHDGTGKVLSSNLSTWYEVNGSCVCKAARNGHGCWHRSAWLLFQRVQKQCEAQQSAPEIPPGPEPETLQEGPTTIAAQFISYIQGKPFVKFAGLLDLAHQRGLQSLRVDWTYNDADLSLAHAVAVFPFGTFEESGDATKANVTTMVAPHFRRVCLTRAAARCLRLALNIGTCSVEEME